MNWHVESLLHYPDSAEGCTTEHLQLCTRLREQQLLCRSIHPVLCNRHIAPTLLIGVATASSMQTMPSLYTGPIIELNEGMHGAQCSLQVCMTDDVSGAVCFKTHIPQCSQFLCRNLYL